MRLEGKVAIITGAASGIGLATAQRFASEGARVVIADLKPEKARAAAESIGANALGVACDVSDEPQVEAAVAQTIKTFGGLDVVVNNAGLMIFKPLEEQSAA